MALVAQQIVAKIGADLTGLQSGLKQAESETKTKGASIKGVLSDVIGTAGGMLAALGIQASIGGVVNLFHTWIAGAVEARQNQALLNAVLTSTHDAVGMTADQINQMVESLQNLNGIDKDTIQQGTNMLLTFTGIGKDVFPQANQAMLDMAVAMNGGSTSGLNLKDTAIQLGKALNDPLTGLTALTREGVTFSAAEKEQIKTMMAHHDVAGAQAIMLHELTTEFGGAAAAAGNADPFNKFSLALNDIGKTIGGMLLPPLTAFMAWLTPLVQQLSAQVSPMLQQVGNLFGWLGMALGEILSPLSEVWVQFQGLLQSVFMPLGGFIQSALAPAFVSLKAPIDAVSSPVLALNGFISNLAVHLSMLIAHLRSGGGPFTDLGSKARSFMHALEPLAGLAQSLWGDLQQLFGILLTQGQASFDQMKTDWLPIIEQFAAGFQQDILPAALALIPPIEALVHTLVTEGVPAFFAVQNAARHVVALFVSDVLPIWLKLEPIVLRLTGYLLTLSNGALQQLLPKLQQAAQAVSQFADQMSTRLQPFIEQTTTHIQQAAVIIEAIWNFLWPTMSALLKANFDTIVSIFKIAWDLISGLFKIGADLLSGNWKQLWADVLGLVGSVGGDIIGMVKTLWNDLVGPSGVWSGMLTALSTAWSNIWNGLGGVVQSAWTDIKGFLAAGVNGAIDILNALISAADKVPGVNIPQISHVNFASGGIMEQAGLALVGEQGPELVQLPAGSRVYNNGQTQQMLENGQAAGGAAGGAGGMMQPIIFQVDGKTFARVVVKYLPGVIGNGTGNREF